MCAHFMQGLFSDQSMRSIFMKLSLVVSQGVNAGKVIRISVADFLIGRDPECHLRPASPAVSKQHSGIATRDGKVFVRDCGSTNGTFVNGEQIAGEREVKNGDALKVGPLEFTLSLEADAPVPAAVKATPATAAKTAKVEAKPVAVAAGTPAKTNAVIKTDDESHEDAMAALLLGLDDDSDSSSLTVEQMSADATTVMEMPALGATGATADAKKDDKKKTHTDSASAAADALSKYMRRPRT
jgi:pSer/pThr/pTyr-binding forkhead associated (FHA) protein